MRNNELFICYKLGNLVGYKNIYSRAFPEKAEEFDQEFKSQSIPLWEKLDISEPFRDEDLIIINLSSKSHYRVNSYLLGLYSYGVFTKKEKDNPFALKVKEFTKELGIDENITDYFYEMEASGLEERIIYYSTTVRIALEKLEKEI